jgi:hypothetical protein
MRKFSGGEFLPVHELINRSVRMGLKKDGSEHTDAIASAATNIGTRAAIRTT